MRSAQLIRGLPLLSRHHSPSLSIVDEFKSPNIFSLAMVTKMVAAWSTVKFLEIVELFCESLENL